MHPEPEPHSVKQASDQTLWKRILAPNTCHKAATFLWSHPVHGRELYNIASMRSKPALAKASANRNSLIS